MWVGALHFKKMGWQSLLHGKRNLDIRVTWSTLPDGDADYWFIVLLWVAQCVGCVQCVYTLLQKTIRQICIRSQDTCVSILLRKGKWYNRISDYTRQYGKNYVFQWKSMKIWFNICTVGGSSCYSNMQYSPSTLWSIRLCSLIKAARPGNYQVPYIVLMHKTNTVFIHCNIRGHFFTDASSYMLSIYCSAVFAKPSCPRTINKALVFQYYWERANDSTRLIQ